jgi:hypothetical protein
MPVVKTESSSIVEAGQERQFTVQAGSLFGVDVRPSRLFFWVGPEREGHERIVSLGRAPKVMRAARHRRFVKVGAAEISYLGNPAYTLGVSLYRYARQLAQARLEKLDR